MSTTKRVAMKRVESTKKFIDYRESIGNPATQEEIKSFVNGFNVGYNRGFKRAMFVQDHDKESIICYYCSDYVPFLSIAQHKKQCKKASREDGCANATKSTILCPETKGFRVTEEK